MNNLKEIGLYCLSFIISEALALVAYYFIRKKYSKNKSNKNTSILKGILERLVVYIGLILGYQSIIIVFGTLKIATRIKTDDYSETISNNYFLLGNFLSIFFVFIALLNFHGLKILCNL